MKKLIFIVTVTAACIITFACQPPRAGGSDAPSKNNPTGEIEEVQPQKADSSIEKSITNKGVQDSTKSK